MLQSRRCRVRIARWSIDPQTVEQGVTLTAIGMGIAFGLLFVLTLLIALMGRILRPSSGEAAAAALEPDSEARRKALAAVVAVNAALAQRKDDLLPAEGPSTGSGRAVL